MITTNNLSDMYNLDDYDVIIVGGGPVGSITGENIKNKKVLIIEEHQEIGVPLQCAGIISLKGVKELGNPKGCVNTIKGAYIYTKNNNIKIGNEEIRAKVFERKVMDKDILIRATKNKNIDVLLKAYGSLENIKEDRNNSRFNKLKILKKIRKNEFNKNIRNKKGNYKLSIKHDNKEYILSPKIIVGADGVRSLLGKKAGLVTKREIMSSAQLELTNISIDNDFVHIFIEKDYCNYFFIWIIPIGKDRVRVGLCDKTEAYNKLLKFINNHPIGSKILKGGVVTELSVGALPIGYNKSNVKNNLLLVGDAAGQVKPLSGGGLYYGAKCGKICGKIITNYLDTPSLNLDYLKKYDVLWKKEFKKEIDFGINLRKLIYNVNPNMSDKILQTIIKNNLMEFINEKGDMDNPSIILKEIVYNKLGI